ncbi:hypothetical protein BX285_1029 [Streptomyces sp. 1114.5]|uniref:DUF5666 domain-containing protein n=1 Tax=unclassified Streptomyces TaxID=2593676 RepID=UPI000BDA0AB9|nr:MULTISPECIES: DUF5666 domain-containing protein [unclassified Streptomyces]RKT16682.1 hypothetical protein BX285_1029 [Streptomyces sp. 1114.5]SOB82853.1 hypothetical protein SAMN06272789_3037 [Streptomyces sp. 1331.2]
MSSNEIATVSSTHAEQVALLATPPDARDVSAELAAPPRRKLPWISLVLAGGVIATGAFAGGVWYEQNNGSGGKSSRPAAAAAGGQRQGAGGGGYGQGAGAQGGQGGRRGGQGAGQGGQGSGQGGQPGFARGTVKAVDGNTVYLTDANGNTVKVTTGDATKVQLNKEGKVADLQPGQSVTVVGTPDANGGYTASQLVEGNAAGGFGGGNRNPNGG